jgi:hypothetical protein
LTFTIKSLRFTGFSASVKAKSPDGLEPFFRSERVSSTVNLSVCRHFYDYFSLIKSIILCIDQGVRVGHF